MRLGFGLVVLAAALSACREDGRARLAADWGCGPVEGMRAIEGGNAPAWVIVGEFTETAEAPAAIADIACRLATGGERLFVGFQDYLGGATDAELRMIASLDSLVRKGAPIILAAIGGEDHPYAVHDKSRAEKAWAKSLSERVSAAGAKRALLLLSRADAMAAPIPAVGDRFAGYSPMPVFLEGGVVSLEVAGNPIKGAQGPAIRIHPTMKDGFDGQLALARLSRPSVARLIPGSDAGAMDDPAQAASLDMSPGASQARREAEIAEAARAAAMRLSDADAAFGPISEGERRQLLDDLRLSLPRPPAQ